MSKITVSPNPARPGAYLTICVTPWPNLSDCDLIVRLEHDNGHDDNITLLLTENQPCITIKIPDDTENPVIEVVVAAPASGAIPVVVPVES